MGQVYNSKRKSWVHKATLAAAVLATCGCDKNNRSFSLEAASQQFTQSTATVSNGKVDILWVVDNSASMDTSQANLANNFASFIQKYQTLGIDYHMAVTTTDAFLADPQFNNQYSNYSATAARFRDGFNGTYGQGYSNVYVMNTTNTTNTIFEKNMSEGTSGSGDERAFSSFVQALTDSTNVASGFRRSDAFLSIIILSDEDDFSGSATYDDHFYPTLAQNYVGDHNYSVSAPMLQPVSYYVSWLDSYVGNHTGYSVSTIYTDTAACKSTLDAQDPSSSRIVATRYPALSAATSGITASLCGNFATTLANITQSVLELASVFPLSTVPNVSTIVVTVAGNTVAQDATNGWTYDSSANAIDFHGTAVPAAGASISVNFTPASAKN